MNVVIDNVTEAQAIAIEDMFAEWCRLGGWGSSRWTKFFADGDGDFKPRITVNGTKAKKTDLLPVEKTWPNGHHGDYQIDYDAIAWKIYH